LIFQIKTKKVSILSEINYSICIVNRFNCFKCWSSLRFSLNIFLKFMLSRLWRYYVIDNATSIDIRSIGKFSMHTIWEHFYNYIFAHSFSMVKPDSVCFSKLKFTTKITVIVIHRCISYWIKRNGKFRFSNKQRKYFGLIILTVLIILRTK